MKKSVLLCSMACLFALAALSQESATTPHRVSFVSGDRTFQGFVYVPEGKGPFPALVWLHGRYEDVGQPSDYTGLARVFLAEGYVLFVPDRHVTHIAPGEYSKPLQELAAKEPESKDVKDKKFTEFLEINLRDCVFAIRWLQQHPQVDTNRLVVAGWSSGGIQTLMVAEKLPELRAAVAFSPGALSWDTYSIMRSAALRAVQEAKAPIFLIQGQNDPSLKPAEVLGKALSQKGPLNQTKIYPFGGNSKTQATSLAMKSMSVWGYDVLVWLEDLWKAPPAASKPPG